MNKIYMIHFEMGQKAITAYECPLPVITIYIYIVHGIVTHIFNMICAKHVIITYETRAPHAVSTLVCQGSSI